MKIALFTDSFGIEQFEGSKILTSGYIKCLVAAYNRPHGHGALKEYSKTNSLSFLVQPKFSSPEYTEFLGELKKLGIDHIISNSYSMIIRPDVLEIVGSRAINIHWSLLPKNRGPNPIQWTLIKGEREIAVTVHQISNGIDEGPIVYQSPLQITDEDTWVSLMDKLKLLSNKIIRNDIQTHLQNIDHAIPQDHSKASVNSRLSAESPQINFEKMSDLEIFNLIRAQVEPLNGAYCLIDETEIRFPTYINQNEIKLLRRAYEKKDLDTLKAEFNGRTKT